MKRIILRLSCFTLALSLGLVSNIVGNSLRKVYQENSASFDFTDGCLYWEKPAVFRLLYNNCGQLRLTVNEDRSLSLNGVAVGSIDDQWSLARRLEEVFRERTLHRVLKLNTEDGSIDKTVYIDSPESISYGDLSDLVLLIKDLGGEPVCILH